MRAKPDLRRSSAQLRGPSHISVGAWSANLLPKSSYEATYIPQLSVIGFAFEEQTGVHALGTSRRSRFKAQTHALAYVPRGCDVFSQSDQGGEYLTVTCFPRHPSRKRTDRAFTNRVDPIAVAADHVFADVWRLRYRSYYIIERRVARARSLVATTKWDLSEISHASGFASHAHMTATFRSRLGVSPNQLRNAPL